MMPSYARTRELVDSVPFWFHSIDVGCGVVTDGLKTAEHLHREWEQIQLPDLQAKTVLDINTWDGFFAFESERRGASVTALDFYMWAMDLPQHTRYWRECKEKNIVPQQYHRMPYFRPEELPGKRGFDVAHELRGSKVKVLIADFMTMDINSLGSFDVVLFLGTLYHMENPLDALKRLALVARDLAVIETEAVALPGYDGHSFCEFFESNELNGDVSNWWAPNERALVGMCRAAGFRRVDIVLGAPHESVQPKPSRRWGLFGRRAENDAVRRFRAVAHAWK